MKLKRPVQASAIVLILCLLGAFVYGFFMSNRLDYTQTVNGAHLSFVAGPPPNGISAGMTQVVQLTETANQAFSATFNIYIINTTGTSPTMDVTMFQSFVNGTSAPLVRQTANPILQYQSPPRFSFQTTSTIQYSYTYNANIAAGSTYEIQVWLQ